MSTIYLTAKEAVKLILENQSNPDFIIIDLRNKSDFQKKTHLRSY